MKVVAYITHAILSGNAIEKITKSALDELVVTDTIPLSAGGEAMWTHPAVVGCGVAGRDHPSHPRRGFGEQLVSGLMYVPGADCREAAELANGARRHLVAALVAVSAGC